MNHNPYSVSDQTDLQHERSPSETFEVAVRGSQIIAGALMSSVLAFSGIVLVLTSGDISGTRSPDVLTIVGAGLGFLAIVNQFIIPGIIAGTQLKRLGSDGVSERSVKAASDQICGIYRSQLIVALALLEGAAFFNLIAMMVEKHMISLVIVVVLLVLMALKFPTREKVSFWVQDKLKELQF